MQFVRLALLFSLLLPLRLFAQQIAMSADCSLQIRGVVTDGETAQPLYFAYVFLKEKQWGSYTNDKGEYFFKGLCPGHYTLQCRMQGYKSMDTLLELNDKVQIQFVLHEEACELPSVVLEVKRKAEHSTYSKLSLEGAALSRSRGLSLGEALRQLTGVQALQTGPTLFKPMIQGMYGNRVLILNNGIRQESQQWGSEHAPEVDPFTASRLSVVKGANSVRYGSDAIGGVVLVDPAPLRTDSGWAAETYLGAFSNGRAGVAAGRLDYGFRKIKGLSMRLQGSMKKSGNMHTPDYFLKNTGTEEYNFSYAMGFRRTRLQAELYYSQYNTKVAIFSASHIGNLTDLMRAIQSPVPLETSGFTYTLDRPMQQVGHELLKAQLAYRFPGIGKLTLQYAYQYNSRSEFDKDKPLNDSLAALNLPELDLRITTNQALVLFEYRSKGAHSGQLGVSGIRQANVFLGRFFIPNFLSYASGLFAIEQWKKGKWEAEAGVRFDYKWMQAFFYENNVLQSPQYTFRNTTATLGAAYAFNESFKLKTNAGTAFRPPHVSELFSNGLHHGAASVEVGDPGLKAEYAYNLNLTAQVTLPRHAAEITVYQHWINDYIYLAPVLPATLTIRGAFPTFHYRQVDASFTGLDAQVVDSIGKRFLLSNKLSLLRAYNTTAEEPLVLTPPARWESGLEYRLPLGQRWKQPFVKLSHAWVFKKVKVPANSDYADPPPAYHLFTLESGVRLQRKAQGWEISLAVYNLLNARYRDYLDRFRYFADAPGRNIALRLKYSFN